MAKTASSLLARTGSFDEGFRDFARGHRARWDGLEKAWVFPIAKQSEVLHGLEKMTGEKQAKSEQHALDSVKIADSLAAEPFSFHSAKLHVELDLPNQRFIVKFPYNDEISQSLRQAGGRWCSETRAYTTPLSALEALKKITERPRLEDALFEERNAAFRSKEAKAPLADWLAARQTDPGLHALKVEADPLAGTYKVSFPFAIHSSLGSETLFPALFDAGALDTVRESDTDRMYPRINHNSAIFEMSQRPALEKALCSIRDKLDLLGPYAKIEIQNLSAEGRRWRSHHVEPQPGELMLREHKAWLIAKSQKTKNKTILRAHPLSATDARTRLDALDRTSQRRICDTSGIDFAALGSYVESLFLDEASREEQVAAPPTKKMRL